ncbi:hypothetical protein [Prevotella nigrescens]|uniref:hypothetical protein n=1 Tax=Prevotella nigrescens TaxID=28133 RepID=UPI001E3374F1|nr:hypothetical protein [Prevotella nigrescens]
MVSLNTSIRTADVAPRPANSDMGFLLSKMLITTMTAMKMTMMRSTPRNERRYWLPALPSDCRR